MNTQHTHVLGTILLSTFLGAVAPSPAEESAGIEWIGESITDRIESVHLLRPSSTDGGVWRGAVTDQRDPFFVVGPTDIDADNAKFLYIRMAAHAGNFIQVFFATDRSPGFSEQVSFSAGCLHPGDQPRTYRFDLTHFKPWSGVVQSIRIDLNGCPAGTPVSLYAVGTSAVPIDEVEGEEVVRAHIPHVPLQPDGRELRERMAAWHRTVVVTDEAVPNSGLLSYIRKRYTWAEHSYLLKLIPGIESDGRLIQAQEVTSNKVEDFPGGVEASFKLGNTQMTTEFVPLCIGRDAATVEGAALYRVKTDPPTPVVMHLGGEKSLQLIYGPMRASLRSAILNPIDGSAKVESGTAQFQSGEDDWHVAVGTTGDLARLPLFGEDKALAVKFPNGSGEILITFAEDASRAAELQKLDTQAARREVDEYYDRLLATGIDTPDDTLDAAFRSAVYNLEYVWIKPIGWLECIHHWVSMWHMQATAGAEWLGQVGRSRSCTLEIAKRLKSDGAVPQLAPFAQVHRDFGGSDQYWAWQVRHLWRFSADRSFAKEAAPALDRVIAHAFKENDPDGNLLLGWGLQVGNQEDFIATPYDGTTSSIEGINMMRTRAELARALGDGTTADTWDARASLAQRRLREKLWLTDLGRFAYFVDLQGNRRLDGQYHTFLYPVLWDIVDAFDGYTTVRHVRDRLTGPDGEVYCSDNFPEHVAGTWGMQAGAAQQPWAAWGLSKTGLRNETWRPLHAVASWVMDQNKRGAWPEVSTETAPCYFSPPAGLFVAAVAEALFGLQMNQPEGVLEISPSFPDDWPTAGITLPEFSASYARKGDTIEYEVKTANPIARRLLWRLPPGRVKSVTADGRAIDYEVIPSVGHVILSASVPASEKTQFVIENEPLEYRIDAPAAIAEGELFTATASGVTILAVDDRCGVLSTYELGDGKRLAARVRAGLMQPYLPYGRLGELTFARRTFFLLCEGAGSVRFWHPVDVTVLPPFEAAAAEELVLANGSAAAPVLIRNNTESVLAGKAHLLWPRHDTAFDVVVGPRSEATFEVSLPANLVGTLSAGDNTVSLVLPGAAEAIDLRISAEEAFRSNPTLREFSKSRYVPINLPQDRMIDDAQWREVGAGRAQYHHLWALSGLLFDGMEGKATVECPELPDVPFVLAGRSFVPLTWKTGKPAFRLDLGGRRLRKFYLAVIPFLDNTDMYAPVARITVRGKDDEVYTRTLRFPGDLDWFFPARSVGQFVSHRGVRPDRLDLLPMLPPGASDWQVGMPPAFPQPGFWSTSRLIPADSVTMNVVELDLGTAKEVESIVFDTIGNDPAFGIVAITGESDGDSAMLAETPWELPAAVAGPRRIFDPCGKDALAGWRFEGNAFSLCAMPPLFSETTLNSLAKAGERATGKAVSPPFAVRENELSLGVEIQGGSEEEGSTGASLAVQLVDAESGEVLKELKAPGNHALDNKRIALSGLAGRSLRLIVIDDNAQPAYAWIGLGNVVAVTDD